MEVVTDRTNPHYRLYEECLSYLRAEYSVASFACSLADDIADRARHLPPCFGTLVNLLADRYPRPDPDNLPPEGLRVSFIRSSVLDFILSGMLAVVVTLKYHVACNLRESPGEKTTESDLYQALFLDCITAMWGYECYLRTNTAEWSPMPWSRASLRELSDAPNPDPPTCIPPTLTVECLPDEHSSAVRTARALVGSPMDVPWSGAPHDGHPFCHTLSAYTRSRREGAVQSLQADAALWVGAKPPHARGSQSRRASFPDPTRARSSCPAPEFSKCWSTGTSTCTTTYTPTRTDTASTDGKKLHVRPANKVAYVAISHVWADGMGSTTEDGLPTCVVERIARLAQLLLPQTGAFWMDSLCVPGVGDLRKKAIKHMARTYRDAEKVLVIHDCIRSQCSESKTWEENLFRIATSGWVWTLQEGLLARELYFEFVEGPVNVAERLGLRPYASKTLAAADDADCSAQNPSLRFLSPESCSSHAPVLAFRADHHACAHHLDLDDDLRLLRLRTTTKPEDELIAVSSLLPMDVGALLAIDAGPDVAQRRVRAFFLQQRKVSKALPPQLTPRLALPRFTWAPRTVVSCIEGARFGHGTGVCTAEAVYFVARLKEGASVSAGRIEGMLRLYVRLGTMATPTVDALLFLEDDLTTSESTVA